MRWKVWLGAGVSLLLLWLAVRGVHLDDLGRSLGRVRIGWLLPVLATIFVRFWLTALRWQLLLRPTRRIGLHRLFGVTMIGFMANNLLPARMGELVRAYALGRVETLPAPLSFATIVIERIFDGFTLLLFLLSGLFFLPLPSWLLWLGGVSCGLYILVLGALISLRWRSGVTVLNRLLGRLPARVRAPAARLADSFRLGLDVLGEGWSLALTVVLSLAIWTVNALGVQAMFAAFALDLPLHAGFLVLAIIAGILVLPSAPGYVGTFQVGTVAGLRLFAVPETTALSLSIVYHAINYVPITATGLVYLGSLRLTLGELRAAGEKVS